MSPINLTQEPEVLYQSDNIGTFFRFNEETRPVDAYNGDQTTTAVYGMVDVALTASQRLVAGARVERFEQQVDTFDPFGLFERTVTAENQNTDIFPGINFVYSLRPDMNLRLSYSTTVNRPEFRELAEFEFTDVVGSRAVRGNPDLERALIQNVDGRWELFSGGRGVLAASVVLQVLRQADRARRHRRRPADRHLPERRQRPQLRPRAGGRPGSSASTSSSTPTTPSSIRGSRCCPSSGRCRRRCERPLAGQSKNLFNLIGEYTLGGFSARLLYNFFGDRISDVGANDAPDIVEEGRGQLDLVLIQRFDKLSVRFGAENLDRQRLSLHAGAARTSASSSWAAPSRCPSASSAF